MEVIGRRRPPRRIRLHLQQRHPHQRHRFHRPQFSTSGAASSRWGATFSYLSQTEVHVYALAISASVLLSFFPFLIVMLTLLRDVFHFPAAERALVLALGDYFPGDLGVFIVRNLTKVNHGRFKLTSILLLLFTANGIFEPLEVALSPFLLVETAITSRSTRTRP